MAQLASELPPTKAPEPEIDHHAVEQTLEGGDAQPLDDQARGIGAGHHRRAGDQALHHDVAGQGAELAEGQRLADVERQRARRLGGDEGALDQAVGGKGRHAERAGRHDDAGQEADDGAGDGEVPEAELEVPRGEPAAAGHHDQKEQAERHVDHPLGQDQQGARAERRRRHAAQRIGAARPPVDLFPPRGDLGEVRHQGDDRHDRHGLARTEGEHQDGQQDDGGAGADDAAHRAGDVADDEDKGVGQHGAQ